MDRDPAMFKYILAWLRDGDNAVLPETAAERRALAREANFYGYVGLEKLIEKLLCEEITVTLSSAEFDCRGSCNCGIGHGCVVCPSYSFVPMAGHQKLNFFCSFVSCVYNFFNFSINFF